MQSSIAADLRRRFLLACGSISGALSFCGIAVIALVVRHADAQVPPDAPEDGAQCNEPCQRYYAGDYEEAEKLSNVWLSRAVPHPDAGLPQALPVFRLLGAIAAARGNVEQAVASLENALRAGEDWMVHTRQTSSIWELAAILQYLRTDEDLAYSLASRYPAHAGAQQLALKFAVLRKGRATEESARSYEVFRNRSAGKDAAWNELRKSNSRLAALTLLSAAAPRVEQALSQSAKVETELVSTSGIELYAQSALAMNTQVDIALSAVDIGVPMSGALVDYVNFRRFEFGAPGVKPGGFGAREYLAIVAKKGGVLTVIDLGSAASMDALVSDLLAALSNPSTTFHALATSAYDRMWRPIREHLRYEGIDYVQQYVYVAPDGQLSRVPFDALYDGESFITDQFQIAYVVSGREVFGFSRRAAPPSTSVSVFAAPDFAHALPRDLRSERPAPLSGAAKEARDVARLFPRAAVATGRKASRAALLAVDRPGILHLATHGFFLNEPSDTSGGTRGFEIRPLETVAHRRDVIKGSPLARAGLLMAGSAGELGGVVTALEVSNMNLEGTQLVVLSACNTARGATQPGQGISGLTSAVFAAGAEAVIASLWRINDHATRTLIRTYYQGLLNGDGRIEALRNASKAVRTSKPHPYFWAPFVGYGRDARLSGAADAAIPPPPPRSRGIVVTPVTPGR